MIAKARGSTVEYTRRRIINDIEAGVFNASPRLTTENLARRYKVSRTPVREALSQLTREGLVKAVANAGYQLNRLSGEELLEIYELRERLEGLAAAKLAAADPTPELIAEMRELCSARRNAQTFDQQFAADHDFHQLICDNCGAPTLQSVIRNYLVLSKSFAGTPGIVIKNNGEQAPHSINDEHDEIVDAVAAGNAKLAERLLRRHIANAANAIRKSLKAARNSARKQKAKEKSS